MNALPAASATIGEPRMKDERMTEEQSAEPDRNGMPEKIGTALGFILVVFVAAELLYAIVYAVMGW